MPKRTRSRTRLRRRVKIWLRSFAAQCKGCKPIHVLHVYKTGGTALKAALSEAGDTTGLVLFTHKHSITIREIPRGQNIIVFLRDPIERFISIFYDRKRQGRPRYATPWSPAEADVFSRYATPNALAETLSADDPAERQRALSAMQSFLPMIQPIAAWLGTPPELLARHDDILLIGLQERLEQDFEHLKRQLASFIHRGCWFDSVDGDEAVGFA